MSLSKRSELATADSSRTKKRKRSDHDELEVDLEAPEPPSRKSLRKAKKGKTDTHSESSKPVDSAGERVTSFDNSGSNTPKRSDYGIWIGNLSFTTTQADLLTFITGDSDFPITRENVTRLHLPQGAPKFGKPQNKGFAYLDFSDAKSLQNALEQSEKLLAGRRVLIKNAKDFKGRPQKASTTGAAEQAPSRRIFLGNLAFDTTLEDLERHFGVCGPVQNTHMATFEDSGKCKGYAWIEFEDLPSAQAAMRGWVESRGDLDERGGRAAKRRVWLHDLHGRKLRLEYAEDKATRYRKRFGKDSRTPVPAFEEEDAEPQQGSTTQEALSTSGTVQVGSVDAKGRRPSKSTRRNAGYSESTVQRLTGAIVQGQGQKVTFE